MDYFFLGIGLVGVILAISAYTKVSKLEKVLKEKGILPEGWE